MLGRTIASVLPGLSSVVILCPHWHCIFHSSTCGIRVCRVKPGQSPENGIPQKAHAVISWISQQHPLNFFLIFLFFFADFYYSTERASSVVRLLWKPEMALPSPKSVAGDLTQREELMLHNESCFHFLSTNVITVGKWKFVSPNSLVFKNVYSQFLVWYWDFTLKC